MCNLQDKCCKYFLQCQKPLIDLATFSYRCWVQSIHVLLGDNPHGVWCLCTGNSLLVVLSCPFQIGGSYHFHKHREDSVSPNSGFFCSESPCTGWYALGLFASPNSNGGSGKRCRSSGALAIATCISNFWLFMSNPGLVYFISIHEIMWGFVC